MSLSSIIVKDSSLTIRRYKPSDHANVRALFRQGMESLFADASLAVIQAPSVAVPTLALSTTVTFLVSRFTSRKLVAFIAGLVAATIPVAVCCFMTIRGFGSWIQQVLEKEDLKSPENLRKRFGDKGAFLVAEDPEGTLLGMVAAEPTKEEGVFELRRMSVSSKSQKRGIGKQLIQKLEEELGSDKKQIYLICSSVQYAAHRLYENSGFTKVTIGDYGKWQGIRFFRYEKNFVCK